MQFLLDVDGFIMSLDFLFFFAFTSYIKLLS